ncbi:MAG: response regulator [Anaerolineae bacterium]|nr:response regulator [Anaerolineae bacterium]
MSTETRIVAELNPQDYNILIVDDTPANLKMLVEYLEHCGFSTRMTRSGENALKRVQYDLPDLILLDVLMPGLDGFETCRRLKATESTRNIPVIFMTALASIEDKVKGFEVGAVDYVTKPLNQEEVLARITTHLRHRGLTQNLQDKISQIALSNQIEKSRLLEAVREQREQLRALNNRLTAVQEEKQKQLARELHDELGQALTAISINLAAIEEELPANCEASLGERLQEAILLTDQTLEQIRRLSIDLRPLMLDELGLIPALRSYVKQYAKRVKIKVKFEAVGLEQRLPSEIETALFRIVQEALTNVARHAQASQVHLYLRRKKSTLVTIIEDNGRGFDVATVAGHSRETLASGTGLLGIRERVTLLEGHFDIQSTPGQMTSLSIEIPYDKSIVG